MKLRNSDGEERVTWGVDLSRVFRENEIAPGDTVALNNLGRKQVTVEVPVRGSDGRVERYEEKRFIAMNGKPFCLLKQI